MPETEGAKTAALIGPASVAIRLRSPAGPFTRTTGRLALPETRIAFSNPGPGERSLDAVSQDIAYAITGTNVLVRTADGGQHWTQLPAGSRPGRPA